jgi:hypothetical protein
MNEPVYDVKYSAAENQYVFESIGKNGTIIKVVQLVEMQDNVYNLGFGDFNPITGQVNDDVKSDNGDMVKVLSTVLNIANQFLAENNPMTYVHFKGSDIIRNRLYQIAINQYYDEFSDVFEIYGLNDRIPELFKKNKFYEAFLIRKLF